MWLGANLDADATDVPTDERASVNGLRTASARLHRNALFRHLLGRNLLSVCHLGASHLALLRLLRRVAALLLLLLLADLLSLRDLLRGPLLLLLWIRLLRHDFSARLWTVLDGGEAGVDLGESSSTPAGPTLKTRPPRPGRSFNLTFVPRKRRLISSSNDLP